MINRPVATMTRRGFITDPVEKVDFILAHFFETLPSQSWLFRNENVSVQSLVAKHTGDPLGLISDLNDKLNTVFLKYFSSAQVSVELANEAEFNINGRADIKVFITVVQNNKSYDIERHLRDYKSVFRLVVEQVNHGERE